MFPAPPVRGFLPPAPSPSTGGGEANAHAGARPFADATYAARDRHEQRGEALARVQESGGRLADGPGLPRGPALHTLSHVYAPTRIIMATMYILPDAVTSPCGSGGWQGTLRVHDMQHVRRGSSLGGAASQAGSTNHDAGSAEDLPSTCK